MNEIELAWAAGLFDGEGWVTTAAYSGTKKKKNPSLSIGVAQSGNPEVLHRFQRAVEIGNVNGPYDYEGHKPRWQWCATGKNAFLVMEKLEPYLCTIKLTKFEELKLVVVQS